MASVAIVLAAGAGTRLGAITKAVPKWLLRVGNAPIADYHLSALRLAGATSVIVVAGHNYEAVAEKGKSMDGVVEILYNAKYHSLNNWYSLLLGLRAVGSLREDDSVLVVNSDLWSSTEWLADVFRRLLQMNGARLAVDRNRQLTQESMKVASTSDGHLASIGKVGVARPAGEYIGALALDHNAVVALESVLSACESEPSRSDEWYEHSINRSLDRLDWQICSVPHGQWVEIDDVSDLIRAEAAANR